MATGQFAGPLSADFSDVKFIEERFMDIYIFNF